MASIIERKNSDGSLSYQVKIRKAGYPQVTETFTTKKEAVAFAKVTEAEMIRGSYKDVSHMKTILLSDLLDYWEPLAKTKKSYANDLKYRIAFWRSSPLANRPILNLSYKDFNDFRDSRISAGCASSTVKNDLAVIVSAWKVHPHSMGNVCPASATQRTLKPSKSRNRRLSQLEREYLFRNLEDTKCSDEKRKNRWAILVVRFALATSARLSEILFFEWQDIKGNVVHLRETKNGAERHVPLSPESLAVLEEAKALGGKFGKVFKTTKSAVDQSWRRALERARFEYKSDGGQDKDFLVDLHFHDLRHEAASTWARKVNNVFQLQLITGHRDVRSLSRYVNQNENDARELATAMQLAYTK